MAEMSMDRLIIQKGNVIHWQGIPFELNEDTVVLGNRANVEIASEDTARRTINHGSWWDRVRSVL